MGECPLGVFWSGEYRTDRTGDYGPVNVDKATLTNQSMFPVHSVLEEAAALASLNSILLNSNRPLWQVKAVLYLSSGATGICSSHFSDPKSKATWQAVGVIYRGRIKFTVVNADDLGMIHLFCGSM